MPSEMIVRRVSVNRTQSPFEALNATGRKGFTILFVTDSMPRGHGADTWVIFFRIPRVRTVTHKRLMEEYKRRHLVPADPYSLAAVNEADPTFADRYPNCTQWVNRRRFWCFAVFGSMSDGEKMTVAIFDQPFYSLGVWYAGLPA